MVYLETSAGEYPQASDVAEWEDLLELDLLVLGDSDGSWVDTWGAADKARHTYAVMDADRYIVWRQDDGSQATVDDLAAAVDLAY